MAVPVVLVHGLIGHLSDTKILRAFNDVPVFAPDLLGYGRHREASTKELTLADQASHLLNFLAGKDLGPVHIVGHSVGGAVAVLAASMQPEQFVSITSVEGNFVPSDAFWSADLAKKTDVEVEEIIDGFKADPQAWISGSGVPASPWFEKLASSWLSNQPASTIKAQARAVVAATNDASYLRIVRELLESDIRFNLLAGERSAFSWGVPQWVRAAADNSQTLSGTGHLMMAEAPNRFAAAVQGMITEGYEFHGGSGRRGL